jgi:amphi-Trp domain-containing protein
MGRRRHQVRVGHEGLESSPPDDAGVPASCWSPAESTTREHGMDIFEIEQKERVGREEAATRLHRLADMLARHNDIEFDRGGMRLKVKVPDELDLKLELEVGDDGCEFEIELTW